MQATSRSRGDVLRSLTLHAIRRGPVTAGILMLFVALSTMMASASGILVVTATGASESLMSQARSPHFVQMHTGPVDEARMARFAESNAHVVNYAVVPNLNVDGSAIRVTSGEEPATFADSLQDNAFVAQNGDFDHLLDTEGRIIDPEPGTVWVPLFYQQQLALATGETLAVAGPDGTTTFTIAGFLRDSQMNSSYTSSKRFLVSGDDLDQLWATMGAAATLEHLIQFRLTGTDVVGEFETQYRDAGLEANGPSVTWTLVVLVNSLSAGITAALMILVTALLVVIALLCVRFTLLTTIEQEYREIGVLKAIGVRTGDLNRMYARRYLTMVVAGSILGLVASVGLSQFLLRDVRLFQGPSGRTLPAALIAIGLGTVVILVVTVAVRRLLRHLATVSPVQAIRTGGAVLQSRRTWRLPRWLTVVHSRLDTNLILGLRDVVSRPRQFAVPLVIYTLATFILVVPQNLYTTVTAPSFITYLGAGVSDMRIDVSQDTGPDLAEQVGRELAGDPRIARHATLTTGMYTAPDTAGKKIMVKMESGDLDTFPVSYLVGQAPTETTQVALSSIEADLLGVGVGDRIVVTPVRSTAGGGPLELDVSGIYQDITNGGRTAKMIAPHTSAELMWTTLLADFTHDTDATSTIDSYVAAHPDLKISSVASYVETAFGGTIASLRLAAIGSTTVGLLVSALITALFMRLILIRDDRSIAALRSVGFRNGHIRRQYVVRSLVVLLAGVLVGTVAANVVGGSLAGVVLSTVGLSQVHLVTNPWLAYLACPVALILVVGATATMSARLSTRRSQ